MTAIEFRTPTRADVSIPLPVADEMIQDLFRAGLQLSHLNTTTAAFDRLGLVTMEIDHLITDLRHDAFERRHGAPRPAADAVATGWTHSSASLAATEVAHRLGFIRRHLVDLWSTACSLEGETAHSLLRATRSIDDAACALHAGRPQWR